MKKNGKNYEAMVHGFLESLRDYNWKTYSRIEFSHDDYYVNRADKAIRCLHRYYDHFEDFLTKQELNPRVERIWAEQVPYRVKRVSMAYWDSGITTLNIVRSVDSFTKIFQEICRFFSWNGTDEYKIKVGDTLKECIESLNDYFSTVKIVNYSGPDKIMEFFGVLSNITREMYIDYINNFPKLTELSRDKLKDINYYIDPETIERFSEFHNEEDKSFLKRLGYTVKSLSSELNLDFNDTGLDTILVRYPKDLDEKVEKLKEMKTRWVDEYYKAHPYVPYSSNAHAYQLESSYDIMSDD
jgi:hypothetical protein